MDVSELIQNRQNASCSASQEIGYALLGDMEARFPLPVEGDPGVGGSSRAVALAQGTPLIRLQGCEGIRLDSVLCDGDRQSQLLAASAIRETSAEAIRNGAMYITGFLAKDNADRRSGARRPSADL